MDPGVLAWPNPNASYADKAAYRAQETGKVFWDKVTHMDAYNGEVTFEIDARSFCRSSSCRQMAM